MSHRAVRPGLLWAAVLAAPLAWAQPDPNYVPPKGGYDAPATFATKFESVGEYQERILGAPATNGYQRQVRLKVAGMENFNRLTTLKKDIDKSAEAEQKRQENSSDGKGGLLGGLLNRVNPLLSKEAERQKEVAKDELVVRLLEGGSPDDSGSAAIADLWTPPNQVTGSFFGAKINNQLRIQIVTDDFKPRVLLMRHRPKSSFTNHTSDMTPEFSVAAMSEEVAEGENRKTITFDRSKESTDGSVGVFVLVTSEDGKATTGKYKIRWAPQP